MRSNHVIRASAVMTTLLVAVGFGTAIAGAGGCGSDDSSTFDGGSDGSNTIGDGQGFGFGNGGDSGEPCTGGLCTQSVDCSGKGTGDTTISGVVTDPAGKNPLYNILVYIPNFPDKIPAYTDGPSCDVCGAAIPGGVASSAVTDVDGKFQLAKVPVGANIPVVVQVGKWRRTYTFANVNACVENAAPSNDVYRLPKNSTEGHLPKMAITTGGADTMECLFRRMGIDDSEFVPGGRVTLYGGLDQDGTTNNVTVAYDAAHGGTTFPNARAFWNDSAQVNAQDIIIYSCEGAAFDSDKTASGIPNTNAFLDNGGKMFASHWHRGFFSKSTELNVIGTWKDDNDPNDPSEGSIVTSFPKGAAFAQWLTNRAATDGPNQIKIHAPRNNVNTIVAPGTEWVYLPTDHVPQFITVDTPVGASDDKLCGKAAFSDLHVSSSGTGDKNNGNAWPTECATGDLTAQEKALEFLFFDLSACVQNDSNPPPPPR